MRVTCKNCGGAHPTYECKRPAKKPDAKPSPKVEVSAKSTASRKDVKAEAPAGNPDRAAKIAGTQALPVDTASSPSGKASGFGPDTAGSNPAEATTTKRGRKPVADPTPRQLYQRELMRQRRARLKAAEKEAP